MKHFALPRRIAIDSLQIGNKLLVAHAEREDAFAVGKGGDDHGTVSGDLTARGACGGWYDAESSA